MKKRLAKVLALGLTAAMVAGTPLSAMASEVNAADQAGETAVVAESADSADETEVDAGIASQDQNDASQDPVVNGVDPMSLDGVIQLDDGNWYYFNHGKGIPEMTDWLISPIPALLKDMIKMETNLIAGMSETVR